METYDVVIIGSGLGGLECASILAKEGYRVCVLEKNRQFGGNLQIYARDKCIFDTGIHYIGGLSEGQNMHQFFKYFGIIEKLKMKQMDVDAFDKISFDGDPVEYKYAQGYDRFRETLISHFPANRIAIEAYCKCMLDIIENFPLYHIREGDENTFFTQNLEVGVKPFIDSLTDNQRLRSVLGGNNMLYAGVADRTPLYMHAMVVNSYIESSWKMVDGGAQIARYLVKGIQENGGVLLNYQHVTRFGFENDQLAYVETSAGERFYGKKFISNVHPKQTLEMIETHRVKKVYRNRINNLANTVSVFILNIVLKKESFPYFNFNQYHFKHNEVWNTMNASREEWPVSYALFTPANSKSDIYADCISIMAYMHYDWVRPWENTVHTIPNNEDSRGAEYEAFKQEMTEKLLTEVEKKHPNLRNHIHSFNSSTPLSFRDYLGNGDGSLYGVLKDYHEPLRTFISPRTKIPNLFLTGQNLNMHGVLGVTIGAVKTCAEFLGMSYLLKKINDA